MDNQQKVADLIHAFVLSQLKQSTDLRAGRPRTDAGYYDELRVLAEKIKEIYDPE